MRWDRQNLFVIAGFVSTYFTVILPGFQMVFVITGSSLQRGTTVPAFTLSRRIKQTALYQSALDRLPKSVGLKDIPIVF